MKKYLRWILSKLGLTDYFISAFRFQCDCGREICGPVPKDGTTIRLHCKCGIGHEMMWTGRVWQYKNLSEDHLDIPSPIQGAIDADVAREAVRLLAEKQARRS